jgi:hypothetical protein
VWFKVDDRLALHPKAIGAGNAALGLWVRAGSWSGDQLTDGYIPRHVLYSLHLGTNAQVTRLVRCGLWVPAEDGWQFHDWEEYQPTRAQVEKRRAAGAERLRRWREEQGRGDGDEEEPDA